MKRCPDCYEIYDESENFCELDGQRLLTDPACVDTLLERTSLKRGDTNLRREPWVAGLVGIMGGILICAALYGAHTLWSMESEPEPKDSSSYSSAMREQVQSERPAPLRIPASTPQPDESPADPETESLPEPNDTTTPGADGQAVVSRFNQGPISTGARKSEADEPELNQTVVQMNDGSDVEVDAAWEDGQGVWYRRGGLVSFVESQRVKGITVRAHPKPSPISAK